MKKMPSEILAGLVCVLVAMSSCSVKEDRSACPCRLVLDFSDVDTVEIKSAYLHVAAPDGFLFTDDVDASCFDSDYVLPVPRAALQIGLWSGDGGYMSETGELRIPYGCECPPLYMHVRDVDSDCEQVYEKVVMRKSHCRVTVRVEGREDVLYSLTMRGNVCGYDSDGSPEKGDFSCVAYPDAEGCFHAVLPRQRDDSLMMDVDDGGPIFRTFALGEYLAAGGYDWNAPDLADVTVTLDYCLTYVSLTVQGWDGEYVYDVIL